MNRIITLLILSCACLQTYSLNAYADRLQLQANHPDRYIVVKGDTLWGISGRFLKNPWQWPSIWQMNRAQIKNPHWIYPGDVVTLDMSSGYPVLRLNQNGRHSGNRPEVILRPGARIENLDQQPIQAISPSIIEPFINQPLLIESGQLDNAPRIIAGPDDRVIFSTGNPIYIKDLPRGGNKRWYIYRPGDALIDPDTKATLGVEAHYLGDANITDFGDPATALITSVKEEIFTKDRLVAAPVNLQTNFVPHAPDIAITGRIIKVYGDLEETGPKSVVSINRGALDGLEAGHVLATSHIGRVIQDPEPKNKDADSNPIKLPDTRSGLVMIFKTFDHVSYGLIMEATQPIQLSDVVHNP